MADELCCALCGMTVPFEPNWEDWNPAVFVGAKHLGDICITCGEQYGIRPSVEEDGCPFDNLQLDNVAKAFRDYPNARNNLESFIR